MAPTLTRRQILVAAAALAPLLALGLPRFAAAQSTPALPDVPEMSIGEASAPLTVVEYAMFSCPHCADFNRDVFSKVKSDYIDTGKVRWIFREVYFNKPGLWAALIARCAPQERYFGISDLIFSSQVGGWLYDTSGNVMSDDAMMAGLYRIGRQAGLSDAQMDKCTQDRAFAEALVAAYQKNTAADHIDSTPTFLMNGKNVGSGYMPWEDFKAKLDEALGA